MTDIIKMIKESTPVGQRSEVMMIVLNALVANGYSDDQIFAVFYKHPVGEKFMEKGQTRDEWLKKQIDKSRKFVNDKQQERSNKKPAEKLTIISAEDLKNRVYDHTPLIDGWLETNGSLIIIGSSGAGKSTVLLNILLYLGNPKGSGLFDKYKVPKPLKTVLIQAENTGCHVSSQLKLISKNDKVLAGGMKNVFFPELDDKFPWTRIDFKSPLFRDYIIQIINEVGPDILAFDPLLPFLGCEENSNSEVRQSLGHITDIANEFGISIIICHHTGKMISEGPRAGRGASSIGDWASNLVTVKNEKIQGKPFLKITKEKSRTSLPFKPFYLRRNSDHTMVAVDPHAVLKDKDILKVLKDKKKPFDTKTEFIKAIQNAHDCAAKTARTGIDCLVAAGKIKVSNGTGNASVYSIK